MTTTATATTTTTIRVKVETRDRLNALGTGELNGASTDDVINYLLDEHWKAQVIADWDRLREERPGEWREMIEENDQLDDGFFEPVEDDPYRSDDPEFIAAGGLPLVGQQKDADA